MRLRAVFALVTCLLIGVTLIPGCSQAPIEAQSPKPAPPSVEYIAQWGSKGDGPGHLREPVSIATDDLGNAYIADAGTQFIHKFDPQGTPLLSFQEDALKHPQWIAVDSDGVVYVTDPFRGSVFVFYPGGERDVHRELRLKTKPGKEGFVSVAVGTDELIHVLDSNSGKVDTYTPRFRLTQSWIPPSSPPGSGAHPGPIAIGPDGYLYIADGRGNRIMRFTGEGQVVSEIKLNGSGAGKLSDQFAVSRTSIFAMDADGRMLHVWTIDGRPKMDVDLAPQLGQAVRPAPGLAVSPREELLVLDQPEARVLRYRINF
jgi:DNA-binding beta-propeller fold protein YncE